MENVQNYRDIKLVTTNAKRKKYVSEPNFASSKCFTEHLMAIEMNKTKVVMKKPTYLGQAILDFSKILMYGFYYDYLKRKYGDKIKLCYMDTDSFITHIQTEDSYKDISNDVSKWFDTSAYSKDNRPLPIEVNKKVIGKFQDGLNGQIIDKFCALKGKTYALTINNSNKEMKKAKGRKKFVVKNELTFKNYEESILRNKTLLKKQL